MSAFAVTLNQLIAVLGQTAHSGNDSPLDAARRHLDRATIRLERSYAALKQTGSRAPAELFVRLKGRTQELEAALVDAGDQQIGSTTSAHLATLARQVVEQLDEHLARATTLEQGPRTTIARHSRTPSADLPRRVPAQAAAAVPQSDQAQHAVPLERRGPARRSEQALPEPEQGDNAIGRRQAKALSDAFFLSRLAAGQVSASSSLSNVLRASLASRRSSSSSSDVREPPSSSAAPGPPAVDLEHRIRIQLRRAYFDSFRTAFSASEGASRDPDRLETPSEERQAAWTRLAQDLVDATLPLIPSKLRPDRTLYPDSTDGSTIREVVEQDLTSYVVIVDERGPDDQPRSAQAQFGIACLSKMARLTRVLQRLCAPFRDGQVQALLDALDRTASTPTRASDSAPGLVDFVEQLLDLAEAMKGDLARFKADTSERLIDAMSEADLRKVLKHEAAELERETVIEWCGGEEGVRWSFLAWTGRDWTAPSSDPSQPGTANSPSSTKVEFVRALLDSLFSTQSVALPDLGQAVLKLSMPPNAAEGPAELAGAAPAVAATSPPASSGDNTLPPPLVVLAPLLFELQNQFQALGILAALATLIANTFGPANDPHGLDDLFQRLWTILEQNIAPTPSLSMDSMLSADSGPTEPSDRDDATRLANLVDEVMSHFSQRVDGQAPDHGAVGEKLRTGVDRILRYEDPVWKLLMRRLRDGAEAALLRATAKERPSSNGSAPVGAVPPVLRTGRSASDRPSQAVTDTEEPALLVSPIKGFDRPPFLAVKVEEVLRTKLYVGVYRHVVEVWGEVLEWGEGGGEAATHV